MATVLLVFARGELGRREGHLAPPAAHFKPQSARAADDEWKVHDSGYGITDMGWEIYPRGLTDVLLRLQRDYAVPPLYVTENGGAFRDKLVDGQVQDAERTDYIARHIDAVGDAIRQGVRMEGYMVWSLLDNFEWASGYEKRFGIVHVDYATQVRTPKASALWYTDFLRRQSALRTRHAVAATED
jgi:beta-glucosidase